MTTREEAIRLAEEAGVVHKGYVKTNVRASEVLLLIQLAKNEAYKEAAGVALDFWVDQIDTSEESARETIMSLVKE